MTIDRLDAMRTFVAIVDAGSFSAAAQQLGVSVPAVSRRLAGFEERLGTLLLHRTTRSLELTEYGQSYYDRAKRVLGDVDAIENELAGLRNSPSGLLRVAAPNVFGRKFVSPLMPEFLGLYPKIRVNLSLVAADSDASAADVDASVQFGDQTAQRDLETRDLGAFRQVICASPLYTRRAGAPKKPEDLMHHDCILESAAERTTSWQFRRRGRDVTLPIQGRLACDDADAVLGAALAGSGVACIPSFQIREHVRDQRLEVLLEDFERAPTQTQITFSKHGAASPKVSAFVEFLARSIQPDALDL